MSPSLSTTWRLLAICPPNTKKPLPSDTGCPLASSITNRTVDPNAFFAICCAVCAWALVAWAIWNRPQQSTKRTVAKRVRLYIVSSFLSRNIQHLIPDAFERPSSAAFESLSAAIGRRPVFLPYRHSTTCSNRKPSSVWPSYPIAALLWCEAYPTSSWALKELSRWHLNGNQGQSTFCLSSTEQQSHLTGWKIFWTTLFSDPVIFPMRLLYRRIA